jgi:intraflagellar transport protein 20
MEALSTTLNTIEKEKMMAIGKRNAIENEYDNRKRKMNDLHMLLKEKENELQRVHDHHESLVRILSTQEKEMEKMKGF